MYAVEFQARITDGTTEVSEEYRDRFDKPVRVIISAAETAKVEETSASRIASSRRESPPTQ